MDDATHTVIKSHQIEGWDNFPLADWMSDVVGLPAALGNDADVAGLAEALHGAGKGLSPIFYITIGSGIGGGFIIDGEIYRGVGSGAAEIGHTTVWVDDGDGDWYPVVLEEAASGWGLEKRVNRELKRGRRPSVLTAGATARQIGEAAARNDPVAAAVLRTAIQSLAEAICNAVALLCPRRIVIGGGVSLLGEKTLFEPLRHAVAGRTFRPFAGLTDIVPAALGEEVVVHGAIALARRKLVTEEGRG